MVCIKLLDILDLKLSRPADSDKTNIVHAPPSSSAQVDLHISQNPTCLYQIHVDSKDTMINTFKMTVQHPYKYSGLLVIYQLLMNKY